MGMGWCPGGQRAGIQVSQDPCAVSLPGFQFPQQFDFLEETPPPAGNAQRGSLTFIVQQADPFTPTPESVRIPERGGMLGACPNKSIEANFGLRNEPGIQCGAIHSSILEQVKVMTMRWKAI